jgi:hypothetical protein
MSDKQEFSPKLSTKAYDEVREGILKLISDNGVRPDEATAIFSQIIGALAFHIFKKSNLDQEGADDFMESIIGVFNMNMRYAYNEVLGQEEGGLPEVNAPINTEKQ